MRQRSLHASLAVPIAPASTASLGRVQAEHEDASAMAGETLSSACSQKSSTGVEVGEGQLGSEISMCGFQSIRATGCLGDIGNQIRCSQSVAKACYCRVLRSGCSLLENRWKKGQGRKKWPHLAMRSRISSSTRRLAKTRRSCAHPVNSGGTPECVMRPG